MYKEEFEIALDESGKNLIHVLLEYEKGLSDVTVIYYTILGGEEIPLVTYDTAHGFPHRDLRYLDEKDKRRKKEIRVMSMEEFYKLAVKDIQTNWRGYLREFMGAKK